MNNGFKNIYQKSQEKMSNQAKAEEDFRTPLIPFQATTEKAPQQPPGNATPFLPSLSIKIQSS